MQRDLHHAVTYLVARVAGLAHEHAEVVAYSAQYVDDATNDGVLCFHNGAMFLRCATAHRTLDLRNLEELRQRLVWIPFHFLPAGTPPSPTCQFVDRLVCRPDSPVACEVVRAAFADRHKPYALHRLGIAAHVYVDTWAHQGFAGVGHRLNRVTEVCREGQVDLTFRARLLARFNGWLASAVQPVGHGLALNYPDQPWLVWSYVNGRGEHIQRDNAEQFVEAFDRLCRVFRRWVLSDPDADVPGLPQGLHSELLARFRERTTEAVDHRHQQWLDDLRDDAFGIGAVTLNYVGKGSGSWKHLALGTEAAEDDENEVFFYDSAFLTSDYKYFHDAAKAHRRAVVDDILPKYGICVA